MRIIVYDPGERFNTAFRGYVESYIYWRLKLFDCETVLGDLDERDDNTLILKEVLPEMEMVKARIRREALQILKML